MIYDETRTGTLDLLTTCLASPMQTVLRITTVAVLVLGMTFSGAGAQTPISSMPYSTGHSHGTGHPGSGISGVFEEKGVEPSIAAGIPTAYGAEFGDLFGGTAYQRFLAPEVPQRNDGAAFLGFGVGDAHETVGLEVTYAAYDVVGDPLSDGSLGLKLHRHIYDGLSIAVGIEDAIRYGDWAARSAYAVASQTVQVDTEILTGASATIGVGDGRFNTMSNISEGDNEFGLFGGGSFQVMNRVNVLGTWYGQDLNLGMSVVVPGPFPITLTPVWVSVLDRQSMGNRFALSIGTRYRFR
jgi:hypothetical protein